MRIAVTGSTGLIGSALSASLREDGHDIVRLVRQAPAAPDEIAWDPRAGDSALAPGALDGTDAVIHLAGAGVADRRWTQSYMATIRDSRVLGTRALVSALTAMTSPPPVLLCGSAIGWYGDVGGREVDESAASGTGFLPEVVRDWEAAASPAAEAGLRVVNLRTGLVLSPRGGMLARLLPPFRWGLGARLGSGRQVMSWITLPDIAGAVRFLLGQPDIAGPVNLTTPSPVTNAEFTAALGAAVRRPAALFLPAPALKVALGGVSSDILSSARVMPRKLLTAGYRFQHPELPEALAAVLATERA